MSDFFIERLRETEERTGGNRQLTEYGMASGFLLMLFGEEWYERRVRPRPDDPDPWMLNGDDSWLVRNPIPNDVRRIVHRQRVIRLTNALFTLASPSLVEGFKHLLTRLVNRIMEACFFETEIASMFRHNGFQIKIVKESGKRGEDFDFLAEKDGQAVSVEVTSKIEGALTQQTIENTLFAKRDQVPPHRPAVLYMHVPADWMRSEPTYLKVFGDAVNRLGSRSKRFNAITFVSEEVLPFATNGIPKMYMRTVFNERARHQFAQRHLFEPRAGPNGAPAFNKCFLTSVEQAAARKRGSSVELPLGQ